MYNYANSIDTDRAIGAILSNFETPWIIHSVQDSLNMKFRPFSEPMPNYVSILNRYFATIIDNGPDYREQICTTRDETYREIIMTICEYYNLDFNESFDNIDSMELYGIAEVMYDIFIARFTDYIVDFFISYIMNNIDSIYAYLVNDEKIKKPKEKDMTVKSYIDPKFQIIHANLNTIILNMTTYDISLESLLFTFTDNNTATRLVNILSDKGDIYKNYYASYLNDQRYMAELLTCIKLKLQANTQSAYEIHKGEE